ncbi:hypothetical protein [Aneurinibacillus aneurinilyticus]|uniref:hypothetical protein n=1 Tax=Aneurinibacillus aneurinilyticus TaxID=1391 RepID=UPI0035240F01
MEKTQIQDGQSAAVQAFIESLRQKNKDLFWALLSRESKALFRAYTLASKGLTLKDKDCIDNNEMASELMEELIQRLGGQIPSQTLISKKVVNVGNISASVMVSLTDKVVNASIGSIGDYTIIIPLVQELSELENENRVIIVWTIDFFEIYIKQRTKE